MKKTLGNWVLMMNWVKEWKIRRDVNEEDEEMQKRSGLISLPAGAKSFVSCVYVSHLLYCHVLFLLFHVFSIFTSTIMGQSCWARRDVVKLRILFPTMKNYAIPMATPVPDLLILAIRTAICLK